MSSSDTPSSASSDLPAQTLRPVPPSLRMDSIGIHPRTLVGKVLTSVKRSPSHPTLTLNFADSTSFQVLVDGYNPSFPGVPKDLDFDPLFRSIVDKGDELNLTIVDCALITMSDRAFERKQSSGSTVASKDLRWDQKHLALAFKFSVPNPRWHCVWAMLEARDELEGLCVFRSYDDVYLQQVQRSPRKQKHRRTNSSYPKRQTAHPWD